MPQAAQATVFAKSDSPRRLHPFPVRLMHSLNALAIFIMIGSGWKIYNDDVLFSFLRFPDGIVIGRWAQYGLQWHFFGMWIFVLNGLAYLIYASSSASVGKSCFRFRRASFSQRWVRRCGFVCATTISRTTTPCRRYFISA